jgi:hypothetical protein
MESTAPRLGWGEVLRLGVRGLASDVRHHRRTPAFRSQPTVHALDPRLRRPLFIIGAPRSGTSFLGKSIGRAPDISYHFEPLLTKAAVRSVYDGSWSQRQSAAVFRLNYSVLLLSALDGGRRFAEKNPENSFVLPFLAQTWPDAQFIHIMRDGRDAAVSHAEQPWLADGSADTGQRARYGQPLGPYARWWVEPGRREEFTGTSDIVRSAWCWRRFTEAALDGLATLPAERVIEVRYESVVADPGHAADELGRFLDLTPAGQQAIRDGLSGAHSSSVGRWREALDEDQVANVDREIGGLLTRLGYA